MKPILNKLSNYLPELLAFGLLASGRWQWFLGWCALSGTLGVLSYAFIGPAIFQKNAAGALPLLSRVIHAPWIWEYRLVVAADRWYGLPAVNEVSPGLWLGRRLLPREVPEGIGLVVDLTAEAPRIEGLPEGVDYVCLPTLDGTAPEAEGLVALVDRIVRCSTPVLIHCAKGQGRSATVMAAVLVDRGLASDIQDAVVLMRRSRPRVRLHLGQRRCLRAYFQHGDVLLADSLSLEA